MVSDNVFGLTIEAKTFLKIHAIKKIKVRNGSRHYEYDFIELEKYYGLMENIPLKKYNLNNNGIAVEFVESDQIWTNGPLIFLGLKISYIKDNDLHNIKIQEFTWNERIHEQVKMLR